MNCLIAPPRAIRSKFFLLTGRLYWLSKFFLLTGRLYWLLYGGPNVSNIDKDLRSMVACVGVKKRSGDFCPFPH